MGFDQGAQVGQKVDHGDRQRSVGARDRLVRSLPGRGQETKHIFLLRPAEVACPVFKFQSQGQHLMVRAGGEKLAIQLPHSLDSGCAQNLISPDKHTRTDRYWYVHSFRNESRQRRLPRSKYVEFPTQSIDLGKSEDLIRYVEDRPGHDRRYAIDSSAIRVLGWKPQKEFMAGLKEITYERKPDTPEYTPCRHSGRTLYGGKRHRRRNAGSPPV